MLVLLLLLLWLIPGESLDAISLRGGFQLVCQWLVNGMWSGLGVHGCV